MNKITQLIILLSALIGLNSYASQAPFHNEWMKKSTQELMEIAYNGKEYFSSSDSTLTALTIVTSRYNSDMNAEEQTVCATAFVGLCEIYFHNYFNYPKCFECLQMAQKISDANNLKMPQLYLGWGCLYQTLAEEHDNPEWAEKAFQYYRKAFQLSYDIKDDPRCDMAFTNVLSMAFQLDKAHEIEADWQRYAQLPLSHSTRILRQYNRMMYEMEKALQEGNGEQAQQLVDRQLTLIKDTEYGRLQYFTYFLKSEVYIKMGMQHEAIATLLTCKDIAIRMGMKDGMLEAYGLLAEQYAQIGDQANKYHFQDLYYKMKDTLTSYRQVASVKEMEMHEELKEMQVQVKEMENHRKMMGQALIVAIIFLTTVVIFLVIVYLQNRRLRLSALSLYRKNVEMLKAEDEQRNLRKQIDEEKYKNSSLDEDEKQRLVNNIREVMESNEIYSPDFSVERLAFLVNSKYKYVSQVIHETYDCNFNYFLNEYRIKEACKRMGAPKQYGMLTIEAISQSVGFKSRSTFVSSFKRVTGLTPSEYQKLAKSGEMSTF